MVDKIQRKKHNLKELAIAYRLACNFDYCPNEDEYDQAIEYYGEFSFDVLIKYQGNRPDEIAGMICDEVLIG